jgi:uncharacterized membrane protein
LCDAIHTFLNLSESTVQFPEFLDENTHMVMQEIVVGIASQAAESGVRSLILELVLWLQEGTELLSVVLIGIGVLLTAWHTIRLLLTGRRKTQRDRRLAYQSARLILSRFLAMALEFQLAADLLGTTVAPSWDQLGRLGAIAVIRTFLNYFLAREINDEEKAEQEAKEAALAR